MAKLNRLMEKFVVVCDTEKTVNWYPEKGGIY